VVGTDVPESWITELEVNPVPVTTIGTADEPTGMSFGDTDVIARGVVTGVVLPPTPEGDPELAGKVLHPESRMAIRQEDTARRTNPRSPEEQFVIETADYWNIG
jgi:hypothetical protein